LAAAASRTWSRPTSGAKAIERGAPIPGEIRIGDRNFDRAASLHRFREEGANQADFIVRVDWNAFSLIRPDGSDFDLITHLGTLPANMAPHEVTLHARVGVLDPPLPLRLIVRRKTPETTEAARNKLRAEASRKQKVLDPRRLIAAEFMILATSLPAEGYPAEEVLAVYRLRWQIELAFKRLKSLLRMDRIPTRTERASRSWLTAHLILALLCDDLSQEFLESSPWRPARCHLRPLALARMGHYPARAAACCPRQPQRRGSAARWTQRPPPARPLQAKTKATCPLPHPVVS
jgi:hypothetical protein